jgi:hypothetical protein
MAIAIAIPIETSWGEGCVEILEQAEARSPFDKLRANGQFSTMRIAG